MKKQLFQEQQMHLKAIRLQPSFEDFFLKVVLAKMYNFSSLTFLRCFQVFFYRVKVKMGYHTYVLEFGI